MVSLEHSSVCESSVNTIDEGETWMTLIIKYLESGWLPPNKVNARAMKHRTTHYGYKFRKLYNLGYATPY